MWDDCRYCEPRSGNARQFPTSPEICQHFTPLNGSTYINNNPSLLNGEKSMETFTLAVEKAVDNSRGAVQSSTPLKRRIEGLYTGYLYYMI